MNERILIANSVGIDKNGWALIHSPSRWTNSTRDKNVFTYYPWELAYTSALLKRETPQYVKLIDGCLEKLTAGELAERIIAEAPTMLLMEPSTRTWDEDVAVMQRVRSACGAKIIVAGQHATAFPREASAVADYVLVGEYEYTMLDIARGMKRETIAGLYPNQRRTLLDVTTLPWPEDDDVSRMRYAIPGEPSSDYREIQAYATRGCPMGCSFCVCRHLYYAQPNWRPRRPDDVVRELAHLKNKYPMMEGVFFDEECHNVGKPFVLHLTKAIMAAQLATLKIDAMCTYVTLDEEMMDHMKAAGYYLLRVGIETAGEGAARGINMGAKFDLNKLRQVLTYARSIGLKMYGTFTFGAPGSSKQDDEKTLRLMDELIGNGLLWRFQTSICTPQPGTPFYAWAADKGLLRTHAAADYDGGNRVVIEYPDYTPEEIMKRYLASQVYFDRALAHRFEHSLADAMRSLATRPWHSVLVLRSSRMPQVARALETLRHALPAAAIDLLTQPAEEPAARELRRNGIVNAVHVGPVGFFAAHALERSFVDMLRSCAYDGACIIYNNRYGQGYENVEAVLDLIGIRDWVALNAEGALLDRQEVLRRRTEEQTVCGAAAPSPRH